MKTLSIFIRDCGDGSQSLIYCLDYELSRKFKDHLEDEDNRFPDWIIESYQSGDGIQVDHLRVPEECTYESLNLLECQTVEYVMKEYFLK